MPFSAFSLSFQSYLLRPTRCSAAASHFENQRGTICVPYDWFIYCAVDLAELRMLPEDVMGLPVIKSATLPLGSRSRPAFHYNTQVTTPSMKRCHDCTDLTECFSCSHRERICVHTCLAGCTITACRDSTEDIIQFN